MRVRCMVATGFVRTFTWLVLLALAISLPRAAAAQDHTPQYEPLASVRMSHGFISQAAWLDNDQLLTLVITPAAVEVWRTNIDTLARERFISSSLITGNICPLELAGRLSWTISPERNFIFFQWFENDGSRRWSLLDISDAPRFRLKNFAAPAGMQISQVLFSDDDRYAVFVNDSFIEGSSVSVLMMDLEQGVEAWRISSQELSFVVDEWWRPDLGGGALQFGAALYDGEFQTGASIATAAITDSTLEFEPGPGGLITGTGEWWGWAACSRLDGSTDGGYYLEIHEKGGSSTRTDLDLRPIELQALNERGCVLLLNSADLVTNKLWLVCSADPLNPDLIDADCREVSIAPNGNLLVLSGSTNEIRIYQP